MDEIEQKIIKTLDSLCLANSRNYIKDWIATAALASIGALAFFYAIQSTKPKDVLQNVQELQNEVAEVDSQIRELKALLLVDLKAHPSGLEGLKAELEKEIQE